MFGIKTKIKKLFRRNPIYAGHTYYSQDGEDMVLEEFYEGREKGSGFYVDIGAHHPIRFSNTYLFYLKGWCGINIDAMPGSMKPFEKLRPRDINVERGVSDISGELEYYSFEEPALNSFDRSLSEERIKIGCKLKEKVIVKVEPINAILEKYLPLHTGDGHIDFISMDIEGLELRVLKTFDFEKYAPDYFLIEDDGFENKDFMEFKDTLLYAVLSEKGYIVVAKTLRTIIFKKLEKNHV